MARISWLITTLAIAAAAIPVLAEQTADPGTQREPAPLRVVEPAAGSRLPGDIDGDSVPDELDVCNNTPAGTAVDAEGRPLGDLDQDCDTDLDDFSLFQQGMTGPLPPAGACCNPFTAICVDHVAAENCAPPLQFFEGQLCDELDPPCEEWEGTGVLYAPANPDNPAFRAALADLLGEPVDYFDAREGTPTLEELLAYRAVFTWANYAYDDYLAFGNVLMEYMEAARKVILGQWTYMSLGSPSGTAPIILSEYWPVDVVYYSTGVYNGDGTDCVYFASPVEEFSSSYFDVCIVRPGMVSDGTASGYPAVVWYPDRRVYYSPGNTGGSYGEGDWAELTYNMVVCEDGW